MLPMILKLSDKLKIEGESLIKGYEQQIDVASFEHGLSMPMAADKASNSRTAGRCVHHDFTCLVYLNKSYPKLLEACAKGSNLGKAELAMVKMTEGKISEVAKYLLTDVYVSSVNLLPANSRALSGVTQATNSGDTSLPWFELKLSYQSIAVTYNEYGPTGASKGAVSCDALTGLGA